jgi:hypothetical protein
MALLCFPRPSEALDPLPLSPKPGLIVCVYQFRTPVWSNQGSRVVASLIPFLIRTASAHRPGLGTTTSGGTAKRPLSRPHINPPLFAGAAGPASFW